jgi:hypothetical protein
MASTTRRSRLFLTVLGAFFVLLSIYLLLPSAEARPYAATACGFFGTALIAAGMLASHRVVQRLEGLLTGWP